jgi:hypothetical protein
MAASRMSSILPAMCEYCRITISVLVCPSGSATWAMPAGEFRGGGIPGRAESWRGGVGFGIFWVGVSPSVSH